MSGRLSVTALAAGIRKDGGTAMVVGWSKAKGGRRRTLLLFAKTYT